MDVKENDRPIEPAKRWENAMQWAAIAEWEAARADSAEAALKEVKQEAVNDFRMDELDAVMTSVDKWLEGDDLKNNPATRAADAREIALKAIEAETARADRAEKALQSALDALRARGVSQERIGNDVCRGIDVLETRYRKDFAMAMGELATFSFIPTGREHEIACSYAACDWGQGLGGMGRCSGHGNPRDPHCPKFTTEASDYNPEAEGCKA